MTEKRRLPLFYIIYFSLVAAAIIGIIAGMIWLRGYLGEYESAQPEHVAEAVFEKYYQSHDFNALAEKAYREDSFEDAPAVAAYLNEKYSGAELTYNSVSAGEENVLKYIVKSGDHKISSFTLKKSGEKTKRGFDLYAEDGFKIYLHTDKETAIIAPEFSEVFINGKKADESYIIEKGFIPDSDSMPEEVTPVKYMRYIIKGLINEPEVKVTTGNMENPLRYNEETKQYEAGLPSDSALEAEHRDFVLAAVEEYAKYMQSDSYWGAVKPYFDPTTDLYASVRTVEQYFVIDHTGYRFEEEYAGEFYSYDENTFSCRVSVLQVLENPGVEDYKDKIDMTIYLRKYEDKFLIFDWNVNKD